MLKTKSKSYKQISKKKTKEAYPRELIVQVYNMTYAMLKYKYKNKNYTDDEIVEMVLEKTALFIIDKDLISKIIGKNTFDLKYFLHKEISNKLDIV